MTHEEAVTKATEFDARLVGCRGQPLTAQEIIIGKAEDILSVARNLIEAIWMAVAEAPNEISEPIRAIADAAKDKLDEALAKLGEDPTAASEQ